MSSPQGHGRSVSYEPVEPSGGRGSGTSAPCSPPRRVGICRHTLHLSQACPTLVKDWIWLFTMLEKSSVVSLDRFLGILSGERGLHCVWRSASGLALGGAGGGDCHADAEAAAGWSHDGCAT